MIKAIIVDDIAKAIVVLRRLLQEHCPEVQIVGEAEDVDEAKKMIKLHQPQLVFLDIEMAGKNGFDLLEELKERNFHVIFVTAHSEFAIKAFRFSVTDYLLKPVNEDLLKQAVQKVKKLIESAADGSKKIDEDALRTLRIPSVGGAVFVYMRNIIRLEAEGHYTHIYLDNGKNFMSSHILKQFEEHLEPDLFLRIQRSHLINRRKIKSIVEKQGLLQIEMTDGAVIEVPRRSKQEIMKILNIEK